MRKEIDQSGSEVHGDQVAGSKTENTNIAINLSPELEYVSPISSFVELFREQVAADPELGEIIDVLQHFLDIPKTEAQLDIAEKLRRAGREDEVLEAMRLKELFHRKLLARQFSPTAQQVSAYLLGEIMQRFRYTVWPLIRQQRPVDEIDAAVFREILQPIREAISREGIPVYPQEVQGMFFFLTGNCHIRWHSDAKLPSGT
jgi:hypothetical protein